MRVLILAKHVDRDGIGQHTVRLASWLASRGHAVAVAADGGHLAPRLAAAGVPLHPVPFRRRAAVAACLRSTLDAFRAFGPDVAHVQWRICSPYAAAARRLYGVPFLHVLHSAGTATARWLTFWGDLAVAVSAETERELLRRFRVPADRIRRVPTGVDTDHFRPPTDRERAEARRRWGVPEGTLVVAWAGRMVPVKRLPDLVAALPAGALALLAGDGPAPPPPHPQVRRLGWLDDPRPLYHAADVFALPSEREGFALAAAEAMACGLPVVRTAAGGAEEQAEGSLLVPPRDVAALRQALERLAADPAGRRRLGEQARRTALRHLSLDAMGRAYEGLYREMASRQRA
jgi:glycosyltransferase involved in cell wall biosynthesis